MYRLALVYPLLTIPTSNQAMLSDNLAILLSSLIGPASEGDHKIGNARFHVLYAYRDEHDILNTGRYDNHA